MLEINNVNKFFGGLKAVHNASMKVEMGSITGLIGPNGAGKTTLFNTIAGLYDPDEGNIILNNEDISFLKPHELFAKGVLRTFCPCRLSLWAWPKIKRLGRQRQ